MKVKVIYRKNLKMSPAKLAAQVAHAVIGLGVLDPLCTIIVLQASDKRFFEEVERNDCYVQYDAGLTEVKAGSPTTAAWICDVSLSEYKYNDWIITYNKKPIPSILNDFDAVHVDYDGTDTPELFFTTFSLAGAIKTINEANDGY